ncbi:hypothetical protein LXL04_030668 [Taraxacum kok-saghyz]
MEADGEEGCNVLFVWKPMEKKGAMSMRKAVGKTKPVEVAGKELALDMNRSRGVWEIRVPSSSITDPREEIVGELGFMLKTFHTQLRRSLRWDATTHHRLLLTSGFELISSPFLSIYQCGFCFQVNCNSHMGRKKRNVATRSKAAIPAADPNPLQLSVGIDRDGDGDVSSLTTEHKLSVNSSIVHEIHPNLENEVSLAIESDGYSAVKVECEKALNALRRGNHTKALRLMKEMCAKHENKANLALIHRVQGTVCVKVASIIDDPNGKQRHLKNAIESAKKAVMLSPNSAEFAHFYANLLYETANDGKDYEDSVQECERALSITNPIDPGKESLQDESQQKLSSPDARIGHVQNELKALLQKANLGTISSWMKNLGNGEEKFRIIPIRRAPEDPMDVRVAQARRPNDIKKASKTDEERKKEIEVKVAAARLLQQKQELSLSQTETDKVPEPSSVPGQRTERRKNGKVRKHASNSERKDSILPFWNSMGTDSKKNLFKIKLSDIKAHFRSLKDSLAYEVISEALSFGVSNNCWEFWMCCQCNEKFPDPESHKQHILQIHVDTLPPKLQAVLPPNIDSEWTEMLLTFPWKPLDVNASVRMIEFQPNFDNIPIQWEEIEVHKGDFVTDFNSNPSTWPLSNDIERTKLLEKIKSLFHLLIKHKCLAASHLTKVIQFAIEELHPQLLNCHVDQSQSPICICFLGAIELRKVLVFLQELSNSCGVGRYTEKSEESHLQNVTQKIEMSERIALNEDRSSLILHINDNYNDDCFLSWIFSGPTSREQLANWTNTRQEKVNQGVEIVSMLCKELSHLQSLCDRKLEHVNYEESLQLVEDLCLQEGKRRENNNNNNNNSTEFVPQSYESVLRKRRDDLIDLDNEVNRFEMEALTNIIKEAESLNVYGGVNVNVYDLEKGEDNCRLNDYLQLDSCIEVAIQKQKEQLSVELSKIDARIMRNMTGMQQLEAKLGPLCGHDFSLIVLPLVKSYLRAHIENLAEKDATEKSDAAREAFLAELALDSKKLEKQNNSINKRKNKEYRKIKDLKSTNESVDEDVDIDIDINISIENGKINNENEDEDEDDDEGMRRKIELEAEERKLEETLEYQRRIEEEAKKRHLLEQQNKSQTNGHLTLTFNVEDDDGSRKMTKPNDVVVVDDDEKRFQADLSIAVRQSLDAFYEEEEEEVTCIEPAIQDNIYGTGLKNEVGEYNCFLNVIIQSLWHLRRFREEFLNTTSTSAHVHVGDPCVTCALHDIFKALNNASKSQAVVVAPTSLRIALSNLYPHSSFFQEAQMNDASEVLGVIFDCLHKSFISSPTNLSNNSNLSENNSLGSWECENDTCTAHSLFGMDIFERMNCYNCNLETRRLKYTSFFHQINANSLRTMKVMCPESSLDELLNLVEMNHQLACDPEDGGCGKLNYIHHILSTPPHIFTTVLGWQNTCESVEDIKATLTALSTDIDLSVLYRGLDPKNTRTLVSVVCYYGQHYHCFAYSHVHKRWVMYDDKTVKVIGRWEDVVSMCEKGHLQPQVLFYEAVN